MGIETTLQDQRREKNRTPSSSASVVLSHRLRASIVVALRGRVASLAELAREFEVPLSDVIYHAGILEEIGAIELVKERPVEGTGAIEHFYRAIDSLAFTAEEYKELGPDERMAFSLHLLRHFFADVAAGLDSGSLTRQYDHHLSRIPGMVDDQGWKELAQLYVEAESRCFDILTGSAQRLKDGGPGRPVLNLLAFFELPEPTRNAIPLD